MKHFKEMALRAYFYVITTFALTGKERFNFLRNRPIGAFLCYNNLTALADAKAGLFHRTPERTLKHFKETALTSLLLCYNNLSALADAKAALFHRTPERTLKHFKEMALRAYFYVITTFALTGKERFNFLRNRPIGAFLCYNNLTALADAKAGLFHRTPERTLKHFKETALTSLLLCYNTSRDFPQTGRRKREK